MRKLTILAALAAAVLAAPAAAVAHGGSDDPAGTEDAHHNSTAHERGDDHGRKHVRTVQFVLRGTLTAPGTVHVTAGNAHARRGGFVGQDISIDLSTARIAVADVNGDGKADAADVQTGDAVLVKVRLPRRTTYASWTESHAGAALKVRQLVDIAHPAADD